jgi:hypothetical protein
MFIMSANSPTTSFGLVLIFLLVLLSVCPHHGTVKKMLAGIKHGQAIFQLVCCTRVTPTKQHELMFKPEHNTDI